MIFFDHPGARGKQNMIFPPADTEPVCRPATSLWPTAAKPLQTLQQSAPGHYRPFLQHYFNPAGKNYLSKCLAISGKKGINRSGTLKDRFQIIMKVVIIFIGKIILNIF
jgi:hypothetical protein